VRTTASWLASSATLVSTTTASDCQTPKTSYSLRSIRHVSYTIQHDVEILT